MPDSQTDVSELAREVVAELEDTRQIGDQLLLSRREAIALSTGAVSLGALGVAGAGSASAQEAAGQIGTASDPVDVEGAQGNFSQGVSVDGALEAESVNTESLDTDFEVQVRDNESVANALSRADSAGVGVVKLPNGDYDGFSIRGDMRVTGGYGLGSTVSGDTSSGESVVDFSSARARLENVAIEDTGAGFNVSLDESFTSISGCTIRGDNRHIELDGFGCRAVDNDLNNTDVTITSESTDVVVVGNVGIGTITDNGSGSEVSGNS